MKEAEAVVIGISIDAALGVATEEEEIATEELELTTVCIVVGAAEALVVMGFAAEETAAAVLEGAAEDDASTVLEAARVEAADKLEDPLKVVVRSPLSTYTPEKYQSSFWSAVKVPRLKTPKCQSAPLELALAEAGPAVRVSASEPVEW